MAWMILDCALGAMFFAAMVVFLVLAMFSQRRADAATGRVSTRRSSSSGASFTAPSDVDLEAEWKTIRDNYREPVASASR